MSLKKLSLSPQSGSKQMQINKNDIDLIVYDFDGVMTDNCVIVSQDGTEAVTVNRADGLGVDYLRNEGIPQMILSTESNPVVQARAKKLKIDVINNCDNKKEALLKICKENGYDLSKVVFVGNDLNDLEAMKIVGYPVAPSDAHTKILKIAKFITKAKGGEGVIKELAEKILNNQKDKEKK